MGKYGKPDGQFICGVDREVGGSIDLMKNRRKLNKNPPFKYEPNRKGEMLRLPTLTRLPCS